MAVSTMIGAKIHRREDPRLVSGEGRYVDDFTRPGSVFLSVVRSPFAHAHIKSIDITKATKAPGVVAIYTHKDFAKVLSGTMPVTPSFVAEKKQSPPRFPIAEKEVVYQGEPVAVVLAETKYQASDASNLIEVEYEQLPAVMDLDKALEANSPKVHSGAPDNLGWDLTYIPDDPAVMKEADVVVKERILQQRLAPTPMETRGVLAEYSKPDGTLTVWMSSQSPHFSRLFLAGAMGIPETRIRVISPDVGGGFGSKISPYSEDWLVPAAAKLSGRPVKWIESRTESLQTTTHGRGGSQEGWDAGLHPSDPIPGRGCLHGHFRRVPGVRLPAGGRRLQLEARRGAHGRRPDQQGPDRSLPRRRPPGGDPPVRADDRPARGRSGDGSGGDSS
jgi:carbon-monoxide dehydrogenase large subunit